MLKLNGKVVQVQCNHNLGDNCIQSFHLGRYIVRYMVGNLVLRQHASGAVKRDFRTYICISDDIPPQM